MSPFIPGLVCPSCRQSYLQAVYVLPLDRLAAWICDECEAFWLERPDENPSAYVRLSEFMREHCLTGS